MKINGCPLFLDLMLMTIKNCLVFCPFPPGLFYLFPYYRQLVRNSMSLRSCVAKSLFIFFRFDQVSFVS